MHAKVMYNRWQLDNTTAENKNWAVLDFAGLLVELGWFDDIFVCFLPRV